ncbi:MAG: hypothetical protein ABR906_11685 [Terracidiphilus sp.]|jgi:hypothetical protein
MEQDPGEAEATLHRLNETRATLRGVNHAAIPEGRVINRGSGVTVTTSDGRRYTLRADGTLAHFQSGLPSALSRGFTTSRPVPPNVPGVASTLISPRATPSSPMGNFVSFRPDGKIISMRIGGPEGLNIQHGVHGERVVSAHRPDHITLVSTGRHSGYIEKTLDQDGRTLVERTYLSGSRSWTRTYSKLTAKYQNAQATRPLAKIYRPRYRYAPSFYGWASSGWRFPINYQWKWASKRWYAHYSLYFYPWPSYTDGSYWLTDYVLGQTLADGYDMQQPDDGSNDANAGGDANADHNSVDPGQQSDDESVYAPIATAIPSAVKQEIAAEVHRQLEAASSADADPNAAQAAAPDDPAQFLQAGQIFIVSTPIYVRINDQSNSSILSSNRDCSLSPGDVLRLTRIPETPPVVMSGTESGPTIPFTVFLEVMASQRADCPAGVQVSVPTLALQEMENDFQAQLDDGLHALYSQQGTNGLPAAPPITVAPPPAALADPSPSATELVVELQSLQLQANHAEANVAQMVSSSQTAVNQH